MIENPISALSLALGLCFLVIFNHLGEMEVGEGQKWILFFTTVFLLTFGFLRWEL